MILITVKRWSCFKKPFSDTEWGEPKEKIEAFVTQMTLNGALRQLIVYTANFKKKFPFGACEFSVISVSNLPDDVTIELLEDLQCHEITVDFAAELLDD